MITTIGDGGTLHLPGAMLSQLSLQAGSKISCLLENGAIYLRPVTGASCENFPPAGGALRGLLRVLRPLSGRAAGADFQ